MGILGRTFVVSDDIGKIQGELLEAAVGDRAFVDVVQKIVEEFGAGGGIIFELNRKTGAVTDWVTPNLIIGDTGYDQHINSINPRMHYALRHAPGRVIYEGRFTSDRGIDRHEFYDWLGRLHGFRYFLGMRVYDEGDTSVFHSIEFDKRRAHPEPDEIKRFSSIARSAGNAWRLSKRMESEPTDNALFPWTPNYLPWAIFALASDGRLLQANSAGQKMLDNKEFVTLSDGVLTASDRRSSRSFATMISAGLSGAASETLLRSGNRVPSIAQAIPAGTESTIRSKQPSVLIYIKDPTVERDVAAATISRLFRLSEAENRLIVALSDGSSLSQAADKLKISRNTARNQLQSVYGKTGTRSQQELLIRILGVIDNR